ncbi:ester cyclase [Streptomyces tritici]|uniref:ester cyclase n=1 Tax=Streptomyces tritici TaxID=2054410 RepID=UPI003AF040A6
MDRDEMTRLCEAHRAAEAARDYDGILRTFADDCFFETVPLGRRSRGRAATRAAYEGIFTAFPDLTPDDKAMAYGDDVVVVWGTLRGTSRGAWLGVPPSGRPFTVPFTNVVPFREGLMAGESVYFDLATLCEQAGLDLDRIRAAAKGTGPTGQPADPGDGGPGK